MIAQTLVNLSAGSRARLSGIVAALDSCYHFVWCARY
jgi:MFS superfamily sulfate permease-like transporter